MNILIIEEDLHHAISLREILDEQCEDSAQHCSFIHAAGPKQLVAIVADCELSVALIDQDLPHGGAAECLTLLTNRLPDVPVFLLVDEDRPIDQKLVNHAAVTGTIRKEDEDKLPLLTRLQLAMDKDQAVAQLQQAKQQLVQQRPLAVLGSLAGGIAHQLNDLNTVIFGHLDRLLDDENINEAQRESLQRIRSAAESGASVTKDLLSVVRPEQRSAQMRLGRIVDQALSLTRDLLQRNHVRIEQACSRELLCCRGDGRALCQALLLLITRAVNVLQTSFDKRLTIALLRDSDPRMARIIISHEGQPAGAWHTPGQRAVFPYRAGANDQDDQLETCRHLIGRLCGELQIDETGGSSTINIMLPLMSAGGAPRHQAHDEPTQCIPVLPDSNDPNKRRILVVEDQDPVLELIAQTLSDAGWEVLAANNGAEALRIMQHQHVDALVVDVQMPEMDGRVFLASVKEIYNSLPPTLVCSGWLTRQDLSDLKKLGAERFISKPFRAAEMVNEVRAMMEATHT